MQPSELVALIRDLPPGELMKVIEITAEKRDQRGAYLIRQHVRSKAALWPEEVAGALFHALDAVSGDSEPSLADLVAAQHVYQQFVTAGPSNDFTNLLGDPLALMDAARTAAVVPVDSDGNVRILEESEVVRLLAVAGVPREAPGDPAKIPGSIGPDATSVLHPETLLATPARALG